MDMYEEMLKKHPNDKSRIDYLLKALKNADQELSRSYDEFQEALSEKKSLQDALERKDRELESLRGKHVGNLQKFEKEGKEIYSSKVVSTELDYTEDDGTEYFKLPNKEMANEMLIDSGHAVIGWKVKIHLEIIS